MKIDDTLLQQIEMLAKITLEDDERQLTKDKIKGVLDMLDSVAMDSIANVEPLYHPLEIIQPLRDDSTNPSIDRASNQQHAPQVEQGLFIVPKVIE